MIKNRHLIITGTLAYCKYCNAHIIWATSKNGKTYPIDAYGGFSEGGRWYAQGLKTKFHKCNKTIGH